MEHHNGAHNGEGKKEDIVPEASNVLEGGEEREKKRFPPFLQPGVAI